MIIRICSMAYRTKGYDYAAAATVGECRIGMFKERKKGVGSLFITREDLVGNVSQITCQESHRQSRVGVEFGKLVSLLI